MRKLKRLLAYCMVLFWIGTGTIACSFQDELQNTDTAQSADTTQNVSISGTQIDPDKLPDYSGSPYIEINDNVPDFPEEDYNTKAFEVYSSLDNLGRCGAAYANIDRSLMPAEKRGNISEIKPTGWHHSEYDFIDGKSLYNRCHLIAYQLTAENANERNLITGTRYMNVEGMLPFENKVGDYIRETDNHVLYRVTPIFAGDDLVARGVQMEAESVEDSGKEIRFNVFCYNVQPGVSIDYGSGANWEDDNSTVPAVEETTGTETWPAYSHFYRYY